MGLAESLKSVASVIPGVKGYFSREEVRDADKTVREHVAKALDAVKGRVDGAKRTLVDAHKLMALSDLDRVSSVIDRVRNRFRTAEYGHGSFFSSFKVDETVLGKLMEFDRALGDRVAALAGKADALDKAGADEAAAKTAAASMESDVKAIDSTFSDRDLILGK
jgi:hypothetical protein